MSRPACDMRLYQALCACLRGEASPGVPGLAWFGHGALDAVAISLAPEHGAPAVEVWLGSGVRRGDIPRRISLDGTGVELCVHPHCRPTAQLGFATNADREAESEGMVSALVRDRFNHGRHYVLSCGHVLAGTPDARHGDQIEVTLSDGIVRNATLVDWQPVLGDDVPRVGLDAGIAVVEGNTLAALRKEPLPAGILSSFSFDKEVVMRRRVPVGGLLKTRWSGYVDLASTEHTQDYYLENAIGYETAAPAQGGDSGAPVWTANGDLLAGIHVGAPCGDERWRSNAILCPIERIMKWFDIEPCLAGGGAAVLAGAPEIIPAKPSVARAADPAAPPQPPAGGNASDDLMTLAMTLWGEARGEGRAGMEAVACVIGNRVRRNWRQKAGYVAVCRDKWQFSCWNANDPNLARMEAQRRNPDALFQLALEVAERQIRNALPDMTFGATHYYAVSLRNPPFWANNKQPCYQLGNHLFFNNVN